MSDDNERRETLASLSVWGKNLSVRAMLISIAAFVGALTAIVTQGPPLWSHVGWISPQTIELRIASLDAAHKTRLELLAREAEDREQVMGDKVDDIMDLIVCEKYDKELTERLERQQAGDNTVVNQERIARLRQLRQRRDCARFDE